MTVRVVLRRALLAAAALLLLLVAWESIAGALRQLPRSRTLGQQLETAVQLACGALSLLGVVTCFLARRWNRAVLVAWAVSLAASVGSSSLVWGPPMLLPGLALTTAALLVALAIAWMLRAGLAGMAGAVPPPRDP